MCQNNVPCHTTHVIQTEVTKELPTPEFKINEFLHQQKMSQMGWTPLTHGKTRRRCRCFSKASNKRKRGGQQLSYARRVRQEIKLAYHASTPDIQDEIMAMTM